MRAATLASFANCRRVITDSSFCVDLALSKSFVVSIISREVFMKKIWLLSLVLYVAAALPVRGASTYTANKWKDEFTKHWQTTKEFTLDVANAMPAEN